MGAVYLLSALGVDGHTIRQDYLATNDLIQPMVEKNLAAARKRGATDALLANIRDLGTVSGAFLDSALATIDAEYGNMHNYLKEAQLTDAEKRFTRTLSSVISAKIVIFCSHFSGTLTRREKRCSPPARHPALSEVKSGKCGRKSAVRPDRMALLSIKMTVS